MNVGIMFGAAGFVRSGQLVDSVNVSGSLDQYTTGISCLNATDCRGCFDPLLYIVTFSSSFGLSNPLRIYVKIKIAQNPSFTPQPL